MSDTEHRANTKYTIRIIVPYGPTSNVMYSMDEAGRISAVLKKNGWKTSLELAGNQISSGCNEIIVLVFRWEGDELGPLLPMSIQAKPAAVIVLGRIVTSRFENILSSIPEINAAVLGEPEKTLCELLTAFEQGTTYKDIKGIAFMENGKITKNASRECLRDLDSLPWPDRSYLNPDFGFPFPVVPIESARGCRGVCAFCTSNLERYNTEGEKQIRMRQPQAVVDEINSIVDTYGKKIFYFVDDNFIPVKEVGQARAQSIAHEIKRRNLEIQYFIECRADDVEQSLFEELKASGLKHVFLGLESGSQSALNRYHKGTTVQENRCAIQLLNDLNLEWSAGFILYDQFMNWEELDENLKFAQEMKLHEKTPAMQIFKGMIAYPGTAWAKQVEAIGINAGSKYFFTDSKVEIFIANCLQYEQKVLKMENEMNLRLQAMNRQIGQIMQEHLIPRKYQFRVHPMDNDYFRKQRKVIAQCRKNELDFMKEEYRVLTQVDGEAKEPNQDTHKRIQQAIQACAEGLFELSVDEETKAMDSYLQADRFYIVYQNQALKLKAGNSCLPQ